MTTTTATQQTLKERATEARLKAERAARERQERERIAADQEDGRRLAELMKSTLDVDVSPRWGEVEVDGLRFGLRTHRDSYSATSRWLVLLETCAACGRDVGEPVYNLAALGDLLDREAPLRPHACGEDEGDANHGAWVANQDVRKLAAVGPEKSLGERILDALETIAVGVQRP